MTKSRILLYLLLSFLCGVFARSFFELWQNLYYLATIFVILLLIVFYKNPKVTLFACLVFAFVFGAWQTERALQKVDAAVFAGSAIEENAVVEKVSESTFGQNLIVNLENEKMLALVQVAQYPSYAYGDEIKLSCTLKIIENKNLSFDYRMYMAKEGVLYQCDKPKLQKISEGKGNKVFAAILKVRSAFEEKILQVIPQPEGALADGLLFGGNAGLSKEIQNDFSKTGMTHIVAVSGYNVTIIAEYLIMLGIFLGLWRRQAIWFALVGIILFVVMSGLPASAVRAGVMGGVLLWAMKNGRLAQAENAIIFAAAIMLFQNPLLLRYDVGFELSFLATLGIVMTSPFWEKSFVKKHQALGISETIALSLSAQIFVLPIIAYNFHITSLVSLLANVFVLPIIPLSMLLVFLVSLTGFLFAPLSLVFAWLAYLPLVYEINLIHILAGFPWASITLNNVSPYFVMIYYLILAVIIIWFKNLCKIAK